MRAVVRETGVTARVEDTRPSARQTRVVIRRIQPWSVFKFSLLFYFCLMLVFLFALVILYWVLSLLGVMDTLAHLLQTSGFGSPKTGFQFHSFWIFSRLFLIGVVGVFVWSLVNLFVTVLYNLVSDVVGGIQVTLSDRR
jgi:Transmembrane domain of unknown function (DUF3566)